MVDVFGSNTAEAIFNLDNKDTVQDGRLDVIELTKTRFVAGYAPGQLVAQSDMVNDNGWLMHANKATEEPAAPQQVGEEHNLYDGTIGSDSVLAKQVMSGMRYALPVDAWVKGYRVDTVAGIHYEIYLVRDSLGTPVIELVQAFTASDTGPQNFTIAGTLVLAGITFDLIKLIDEPDPSPTTWSDDWDYLKPQNPATPTAGQIIHAGKALDILSIHYTSDTGDQTSALQALAVGDVINGAGQSWAIQAITDQTTYIDFVVAPAAQGILTGIQAFEFQTVTATAIPYEEDVDFWLGNSDVRGLFIADGQWSDIVPDDNQYGIDLLVQDVSISPDWDYMLTGESTGTGGGGGETPIATLAKGREVLGDQSTSITWDWANGSYGFTVTLTGNVAIGAPTNAPTLAEGEYAEGMLLLVQDDTGSRVPTWDDVWVNQPTLTGTADLAASIRFSYDGIDYILEEPTEFTPTPPEAPPVGTPTVFAGSDTNKAMCTNDSNFYSSSFHVDEAFNGIFGGDSGDSWISKSTQGPNVDGSCYVQWDFGATKKIYSIRLGPRAPAGTNNFPEDCVIKVGSDDTFATFAESTNLSFTYVASTWTPRLLLDTPVSAQYLRLEIHTMTEVGTSNNWVSIQEVEFEELI